MRFIRWFKYGHVYLPAYIYIFAYLVLLHFSEVAQCWSFFWAEREENKFQTLLKLRMVDHFAPKYSHTPLTKSVLCMVFIYVVASALSFLLSAIEMSGYSSLGLLLQDFQSWEKEKLLKAVYIYNPLPGDSQHAFFRAYVCIFRRT